MTEVLLPPIADTGKRDVGEGDSGRNASDGIAPHAWPGVNTTACAHTRKT
ncbi:hypothetical protein [Streptomyces sp. MK37H]|nr:hypothetical protein [Streptomyces sp. MK37H]